MGGKTAVLYLALFQGPNEATVFTMRWLRRMEEEISLNLGLAV